MKNNTVTVTLPMELMREILLRLPVRSVLHFKCVCKSWCSLISDPEFGISHYDLAASPTHRILLRANDFYVQSIDIDAPKLSRKSSGVHFLLPPTSPPHHLDHYYHANFHDKHDFLGSCRGLVLLYYDESADLILWNPSIGVHNRFPDFQYAITSHFLYGFGYNVSTHEYLLVLITLETDFAEFGIHIFSLNTESWIRVLCSFPYEDIDDKFRAASFLNGALHWLVFSIDKENPVIIAFDMVQWSLSEIPLFDHSTAELQNDVYSLRVMGECLSVCCLVQDGATVEIWVMKEYKVQSSWTKSVVIPTRSPKDRFSPICIAKDGRIFGSNICGRLEKCNDKGEMVDHLGYGGGGLFEDNLQCAMYRESLLLVPIVRQKIRKYEDDQWETSEDDQ